MKSLQWLDRLFSVLIGTSVVMLFSFTLNAKTPLSFEKTMHISVPLPDKLSGGFENTCYFPTIN